MNQKFDVELLEEAFDFLKQLELKPRKKILQNINRSKYRIDPKLFKKIDNEIWEFRTLYAGLQYRLLAFWDKSEKTKTLVFATHGFIKKTNKLNKKEINRAENIRQLYFQNK